MAITVREIAWLAGLLEGEGSFGFSGSKGSIRLNLAMSDKDVVQRAADLMKAKVMERQPKVLRKDGSPKKKMYTVSLYSNKAAAWMMTIYVFMGERRKARIEASLADWKSRRAKNQQGHGRKNPRSAAEMEANKRILEKHARIDS